MAINGLAMRIAAALRRAMDRFRCWILRKSIRILSQRRPKRKGWTGKGSGTEQHILRHLQDGPLTRHQLDALLPVKTAGQILPRMVERGQISIRPGTRPYQYELPSGDAKWMAVQPALPEVRDAY